MVFRWHLNGLFWITLIYWNTNARASQFLPFHRPSPLWWFEVSVWVHMWPRKVFFITRKAEENLHDTEKFQLSTKDKTSLQGKTMGCVQLQLRWSVRDQDWWLNIQGIRLGWCEWAKCKGLRASSEEQWQAAGQLGSLVKLTHQFWPFKASFRSNSRETHVHYCNVP